MNRQKELLRRKGEENNRHVHGSRRKAVVGGGSGPTGVAINSEGRVRGRPVCTKFI